MDENFFTKKQIKEYLQERIDTYTNMLRGFHQDVKDCGDDVQIEEDNTYHVDMKAGIEKRVVFYKTAQKLRFKDEKKLIRLSNEIRELDCEQMMTLEDLDVYGYDGTCQGVGIRTIDGKGRAEDVARVKKGDDLSIGGFIKKTWDHLNKCHRERDYMTKNWQGICLYYS